MYFTPAGYINKKQKHRFKRFLIQKKSLRPFDFPVYSSCIRSKEYGFLTGRRIEALRKTLVKSLSFKIAVASIGSGKSGRFSKNIGKNIKIGFKRDSNLTHGVTKKGILTRMGKGKGKLVGWISFQRPGVALFHYPSISYSFSKKNQLNPSNFLINKKLLKGRLTKKQLAYVGPFNSRLPFRCKNYMLNFNLTFNHKKSLLC